MKDKFDVVVACELSNGIGLRNGLPWRLTQDLKYFRELTRGSKTDKYVNSVIMGRNTWESIPEKHRPLAGRRNIILTSDVKGFKAPECEGEEKTDVLAARSLDSALQAAFKEPGKPRCFVIGGAKVYEHAINHECCDRLYLTQINANFECDVFFPSYEDKFSLISESEVHEENGTPFSFKVFRRRQSA